MFKESFTQLLALLEINNTDFAAYAQVDRSYISHLKNGHRTPKQGSENLNKLVSAVYAVALENDDLDKMCALIGCDDAGDRATIINALIDFLYSDTSVTSSSNCDISNVRYNYFGYKLNMIMELLELSNIKLAKMVNIDPSLISRFRRGRRLPKSNKKLMAEISNSLYSCILRSGVEKETAVLTHIPEEAFSSESFDTWLYGREESNEAIDRLIDTISSFNYNTEYPILPISECITEEELNCKQNMYLGNNGLRQISKRFLAQAIENKCQELLLYSDQNMDWMLEPQFIREWASLMVHCIKSGISIHIIHNIKRDINELMEAVAKWTPLYMSGCINPYYSKGSYQANGFTHTLFIAPGVAAVEGWGVGKMEESINYHYYEEEKQIDNAVKCFNKMLEDCNPLMKISLKGFSEDYNKILYVIQEAGNANNGLPEAVKAVKEKYGKDAKLGDYRVFNLEKIPFNNTRIIVGSDFVCIMKLDAPAVTFNIYYPPMCEVLRKYAEMVLYEIGAAF